MMHPISCLECCLAALFFVAPASALDDFWVDPVTGSDSSAGTTPAAPLRTIGEATGRASVDDVVHLVPGTYSEASGETFPIVIPNSVRVESAGGRSVTTVDARVAAATAYSVFECDQFSELSGVTVLRDAQDHLSLPYLTSVGRPLILDSEFVGGAAVIGLLSGSFQFERCSMRQQTVASLAFLDGGPAGSPRVRLTDCELIGSRHAIEVWTYHGFLQIEIVMDRCRILHHSGSAIGMQIGSYGDHKLTIRDSLIAGSQNGIYATSGDPLTTRIERCTIASNRGFGLAFGGIHSPSSIIHSSVIADNSMGDSWTANHVVPIPTRHSLSSDGTLPAGQNNIVADPRFVDPATGNWSLRADSPCLDTGITNGSNPVLDLNGGSRFTDGNLDLIPATDMGALEHAPLVGPQVLRAGEPTLLGLSGPAGGFSVLVVAPGGYAPFGNTTPYGRLFIEPSGAFRVTPVMTTGGGPTWVDISSYLDPSWVGTTIGFQALPRSLAAPAGGAFSNPLLIPFE